MPPDPLATLVLVIAWVAFVLWGLPSAWRQRREGEGSVGRALWSTAVCAAIVLAPVFASRLFFPHSSRLVAWIASVVAAVTSARFLGPPVSFLDGKTALARLEDGPVLDRIRGLAERLAVTPPVVRVLHSTGVDQEALAWAGGLAVPSLVVSDGILNRCAPDERDAIVAHELAHVASGSLWLGPILPAAAGLGAVAASVLLEPAIALLFGAALHVGLRRIVGRRVEIECDRRAAAVAGEGAMARALRVIHALHPLRQGELLTRLVYATGTHPPLRVRLGALAVDDAGFEVEMAGQARDRRDARVATAIWLAILVSVLVSTPSVVVGGSILLLTSLVPVALLLLALQRARASARRVFRHRRLDGFLLAGAVAVLLVAPLAPGPLGGVVASLVAATLLGWIAVRRIRSGRVRLRMSIAFQRRAFDEVLRVAAERPGLVARDPLLGHDLALARALLGDESAGAAELEALAETHPTFAAAPRTLAALLVGPAPERALRWARRTAELLPGAAGPRLLEARAHLGLGDLDGAERALEGALELEPQTVAACPIAAEIELRRGRLEMARQVLELGLAQAPGDPLSLVLAAEVARAEGGEVEAAIAAAEAAVAANPFAFLGPRVEALRRPLGGAGGGSRSGEPRTGARPGRAEPAEPAADRRPFAGPKGARETPAEGSDDLPAEGRARPVPDSLVE